MVGNEPDVAYVDLAIRAVTWTVVSRVLCEGVQRERGRNCVGVQRTAYPRFQHWQDICELRGTVSAPTEDLY